MNFDLNLKQKEAVEYKGGPLLIVAGAGSGKTRTLTSRLAFLLREGINPENIIAITFTNKAAEEMRNRIYNQQLTIDSQQLFIGTFHSLGAKILRNEAKFLERTRGFTIFDSDDSKSLIKKIIANFNFSEKEKKRLSIPYVTKEFSKIKDELFDASEIKDEIVRELFQEYEKSLVKNNAFDFDDLIQKPVLLFQKHPEILEKYQNKFRYILVDEYQDTNTSQYVFIKLLAEKHGNLSVVGDDQQSIFKFRGSDFRNFLNFEKDWKKAKLVFLEENYRSTANIISAASAVISNNKFQKAKNLWTQNPEGELLKISEHSDVDGEAKWVADSLTNNQPRSIPPRRELRGRQPTTDNSIGILYRTNAQSRAIEQALIEKDIPYHIFGGIRFYERKEIKDIVAALRYGLNPSDSISLERLEKSFLKKPFLHLKENLHQKAKELSPLELIGYVLKITDYFEGLEKNYANYQERIENIKELIDFASLFTKLNEFLEKISLLQPLDANQKKGSRKEKSKKGVCLMTVHLAKGLEFDKVFILGVNEGLLPHQMSYQSEEEIEEERRLMYVAMTRAKKELLISFYNMPSRFLFEIPSELVEFISSKSLDDEERYIEF